MAADVDICNLALSHLAISKEIAALDTESSSEAKACRRFYAQSRDEVLRAFKWPFATKFADLAQVEVAPNTDWGFSYRYPTDCLFIRKILSGIRNDSRQSRISYKRGMDDQGGLIYCDLDAATIEYTKQVIDTTLMTPDFIMAHSLLLSAYMAPRLTGGDPYKLRERNLQLYQFEIDKAMATAFNEEQVDQDPESEFIRMR